jgi:hypothetical protein
MSPLSIKAILLLPGKLTAGYDQIRVEDYILSKIDYTF